MIFLRNCPMCDASADNGDVRLLKTSSVDLEDGTDLYEVGFSVGCINCGVEVSSEYRASVVRLWNGHPDDEATVATLTAQVEAMRDQLRLIELLGYREGEQLGWIVAHMRGVANDALEGRTSDHIWRLFPQHRPAALALAEAGGVEACQKCGGEGWLWGHELNNPPGDEAPRPDDTRYLCDSCEGVAPAPVDALVKAAEAAQMADLSLPTLLKQTRADALREAAAVADRLHYPDETKISASIRDAILALIGERT